MSVDLILATGSRAGISASIANGYYMIGRHAECQIRPKSRSVSRRHCVVHRSGESLKVLDLDSTAGTKINGDRIESRNWHPLHDGDELRCGKFCFRVAITDSVEASPQNAALATASSQVGAAANGRMETGDAWQAFDIADFLESQDDADRERRYEKIREWNAEHLDDDSEDDALAVDQEEEALLDEEAESSTTTVPASFSRESSERPRKERSIGLPSIDPDKAKLIAAGVLALIVLSLVVWQAWDFTSGPPVRVIEGLD